MKVLTSLVGTAAVKVSPDDVSPTKSILQRSLVDLLVQRYNFNNYPSVGPGTPPQVALHFHSGELPSDTGNVVIHALRAFPDGYAATTHDTDAADLILTDALRFLDSDLGYRFHSTPLERLYSSGLVVEFGDAFVERSTMISAVQQVVNNSLQSKNGEFRFKRLAFGYDSSNEIGPMLSVMQVLIREVMIERRATEPLEKNRFFCVAPTTTTRHIELLEKIERAAAKRR